MRELIVSDTSCLIILSKTGQLHLLKALFRAVTITPEVAQEFGEIFPDWISVQAAQDLLRQQLLENQLDRGEASAISLALELAPCVLLIDEKKGRGIAQAMGLEIIGTIRVFILAKEKGLIPSLRAALEKLIEAGFRVSEQLVKEVLAKYEA